MIFNKECTKYPNKALVLRETLKISRQLVLLSLHVIQYYS